MADEQEHVRLPHTRLFRGEDDDLIEWVDSLSYGEKSGTIKEVLRRGLRSTDDGRDDQTPAAPAGTLTDAGPARSTEDTGITDAGYSRSDRDCYRTDMHRDRTRRTSVCDSVSGEIDLEGPASAMAGLDRQALAEIRKIVETAVESALQRHGADLETTSADESSDGVGGGSDEADEILSMLDAGITID